MEIQPIKPPVFKGKINTGAIVALGLFTGSIAGARLINKKTNKGK